MPIRSVCYGEGIWGPGIPERQASLCQGIMRLPKPPLIAIQSITYFDPGGTLRTLDPSLYEVESGGILAGTVSPIAGTTWPATRDKVSSVRIAYTAGYGDASQVPLGIVQSMLLMIGHWYRNREDVSDGAKLRIPLGSRALLSPFEWRSYG